MIPPTRLVIASISTGFETYDKPFLLNNDAFPLLDNALCWRKRLIKKPGADLLGRLQRIIGVTDGAGNLTVTISPVPIGSGISQFMVGTNFFTDPGGASPVTLGSNGPGTATLNRSTGVLTITGSNAATNVIYYPGLPVMGIEMFESDKDPTSPIDFPTNVFLDTTYSYQCSSDNTTATFFDVSFYKSSGAPIFWTGGNFQQFFTSNYSRAMFATNNNPGFHFIIITGMPVVGATSQFTTPGNHNLTNNDFVFINEVVGVTGVNGVSGQVTVINPTTFSLSTPGAAGAWASGGIVQYMTRLVSGNGDGIRWYDGFVSNHTIGWVNFAPPLDNLQSSATTYLMGARMIIPFGGRLLAIGTYEATSAQFAAPTYFGNRIRYCEVNATPFYSLPVPATYSGGAVANAWASNLQGFGGFIDLDTTQRIITAAVTQGAMILGLENEQRRMSLTGIETDPFTLQVINPEYGSSGTFSIIPMDKGILSVGEYGLLQTSSYDSKRFDEKIIDQIFEIDANNNGFDRICGGRDFKHEVIYFTYPQDDEGQNTMSPLQIFPNTTIVYNYREGSFALWKESYTTYGLYKVQNGQTWADYVIPWENWDVNWENLGGSVFLEPLVAGGTPQGFVMKKWVDSSFNDPSMFIQNVSAITPPNIVTITSPNHNLQEGQFVGFWSNTDIIPHFIGQIDSTTPTSFVVGINGDATLIVAGVWTVSVIDQPNIYTKQFPAAWSDSKKTRIGAQKYFLDTTAKGEFTVNIYGSQSTLVLDDPAQGPSLISSNTIRTRPDDSLGINDGQQYQTQIWHRFASSAIGDTVQLQFTFSTTQMQNVQIAIEPWVLHACVLDLYPSRMLA